MESKTKKKTIKETLELFRRSIIVYLNIKTPEFYPEIQEKDKESLD